MICDRDSREKQARTLIPGIDQPSLYDRASLNEKLHRVSDKSDKTQQPGLCGGD